MADLTVTAASVVPGSGAKMKTRIAAVAITAGQAAYIEAASDTVKLADCNSAAAEARVADGVAVNNAAAGQPVTLVTEGPITIGATIAAGVAYYLSGTAGGIRPVADNTTGDYPCLIGIGASTTVLNVGIQASSAALA